MNIATAIIFVVLVMILIPAIKSTIKHMMGEGDCCGGPKVKPVRKKIAGEIKTKMLVTIDGMHCVNCKNRIEKNLDDLDGVIAKVNMEKKQAKVFLYQEVDQDLICRVIEELGYRVVKMECE